MFAIFGKLYRPMYFHVYKKNNPASCSQYIFMNLPFENLMNKATEKQRLFAEVSSLHFSSTKV